MIPANKKISIILPAFNEEIRLAHSVKETIKTFEDFKVPYEIIVIDDGSTDNTLDVAKNLSAQNKQVIVRQNRENRGKGRALKQGFRGASGDYVVFLDSDLELHPSQISTFFDIMNLDNADVVIGSKMHPNSVVEYPFDRKITSKVYFWLVKILFFLPINDTQTGIKLFKYEVLKKVFPRMLVKEYAFDLEMLVLAHHYGFKIAEAPVVLKPLPGRKRWGTISFNSIWTMLIDTLAIFYRLNILKYYDRLNTDSTKK